MKKDKCLPRVLIMKNADKVGVKIKAKDTNKIELSELMLFGIVSFCEHLAELGYRPKHGSVEDVDGCDMWLRNMPQKKALKVMNKLIDIIEKNYE
jgi:hypothetical protein